MKLLKKNTQFLLIYLPVILLTCTAIFYILLSLQIHHLHNKLLLLKQEDILCKLKEQKGIIDDPNYGVVGEFTINGIDPSSKKNYNLITDTAIFYSTYNKYLPFKKITGTFQHNDNQYEITTYSSSIETTHLMYAVFAIHGFIYIIMLLSIIIINRKASKKLWKPFYDTIDKLNMYDISKNTSINLIPETGVTEFDELNRVAKELISKDNKAYQSQKQFVENASHEMQTPLAIIRSKSDLLMEQPGLNEKTAELINDIAEATTRLSNLNKTLLLLAKIENRQFIDSENINLSEIIETNLSTFAKHFDDRLPQIKKDLDASSSIKANKTLIDVLFNNLIKNAIIHNIPDGRIKITLKGKTFTIENTGPELKTSTDSLFERFTKDSDKPSRTGLGLAIVKQICILNGYQISYHYKEGIHSLRVIF